VAAGPWGAAFLSDYGTCCFLCPSFQVARVCLSPARTARRWAGRDHRRRQRRIKLWVTCILGLGLGTVWVTNLRANDRADGSDPRGGACRWGSGKDAGGRSTGDPTTLAAAGVCWKTGGVELQGAPAGLVKASRYWLGLPTVRA